MKGISRYWMAMLLASPIRVTVPLNKCFLWPPKVSHKFFIVLRYAITLFRASQCTCAGFWINWDRIPSAYAVSSHDMTTGHRTDPIASAYGTPHILASWFGVDGHWSIENWAPDSIVEMGFEPVSWNFSTIDSMYVLGDALRPPMFPPIFLCHLCIFLLIVASPRQSALAAPIPESDDHMT